MSTSSNPPENRASAARYLREQRAEVIQLWIKEIQRAIPSASHQKASFLIDSLPKMLDELAAQLESHEAMPATFQRIAEHHVKQRVEVAGFTLEQVHTEYQILRRILLETLEKNTQLSITQRDTLLDFIVEGRMSAVAEHVRLSQKKESEALESARQSEMRFLKIFESNMIGVGFGDVSGGLYEVNDYFLKLIGYTREELKEKKIRWDEITPPEYLYLDQRATEEMLRTGTCTPYEKPYIRKDGKIVWILVTATFIDEFRFRHVALVIDVTEKRKAEAEKSEALALLDTLVTSAPFGVAFLDTELRYLKINKPLAALNGKPVEAHIGKTVHEMIPAISDGVEPLLRGVLETGKPVFNFESDILPSPGSGEVRSFLANYYPVTLNNRITGVGGVVVDITEKKRTEKALRQSELDFRTLANSIPQLAWMADPKGEVFWHNQRWYDYTGTTFDEMKKWGWKRVHHPEHLERVEAHFQRSLDSGEPWEDTFPLRSRQGEWRWFLSRALPIRDESGKITRWFGTNTDITDQLRAQDEIRQEREALERERSLREQFVNTLSHDLRNPLAAAKTSAQMIIRHPKKADRIPDLAVRINSSISRADKMIQDLLDANRIRAGRGLPLEISDCDLAEIVRSTCDEFTSLHGPRFDYQGPSHLEGRWSCSDMQRVCENLISNALKYGSPDAQITVLLEDLGDRVRLSVHNFGNPIPPQEQQTLFDPFARTKSAEKLHKRESWGLGLTLVKGVAEAHGGGVQVRSSPQDGTTFSVEVPKTAINTAA